MEGRSTANNGVSSPTKGSVTYNQRTSSQPYHTPDMDRICGLTDSKVPTQLEIRRELQNKKLRTERLSAAPSYGPEDEHRQLCDVTRQVFSLGIVEISDGTRGVIRDVSTAEAFEGDPKKPSFVI